MKRFAIIVNGLKLLITIAKPFTLDVIQGSEYTPEFISCKVKLRVFPN